MFEREGERNSGRAISAKVSSLRSLASKFPSPSLTDACHPGCAIRYNFAMPQWELCPCSLPCVQSSKCPKAWNFFPDFQHRLATYLGGAQDYKNLTLSGPNSSPPLIPSLRSLFRSYFGLPGSLSQVCGACLLWGLGVGLTTPHRKIRCSYKNYGDNQNSGVWAELVNWSNFYERCRQVEQSI